jgi:hypothetical protein
MRKSINNRLDFVTKESSKLVKSRLLVQDSDDINLEVLYEVLESKGIPKTMDGLIYLSDGLYMDKDGDLVEE